MRAILQHGDRLVWGEAATPIPGPTDVRISVAATAVNRADLLQRKGHYPPPPGASDILGLEVSGTVDAVGSEVDRFAVGDAVVALLAGGGYAEQVVAPAVQVMPVPQGVDLIHAAAIPEVWATAYLNLRLEAGVSAGDRVLLHAGASGVGTAAIQLCRLWEAPCFVTVGSADKVATCRTLGADGGAVRHDGPWLEAVRHWAPGGVDVILDPVGGAYLADGVRVLGSGGRLVSIGLLGGRRGELDLGRVLMKRLRLVGSTLRSRPIAEKGALCRQLEADLWPAFARGRLRPIIHDLMAIEEADAAHERLGSNRTVGKLVLTVDRSAPTA